MSCLKPLLVFVMAFAILAGPSLAQEAPMTVMEGPAEPNALPLGTGGVAGSTRPETWFSQYGDTFVRNVTTATLTPVLPGPGKANGAAVVVAPGGGFMFLSMSNEGWEVAQALADRGVAAFVLKYRTRPTPADLGDFEREMTAMFSGIVRWPPVGDCQCSNSRREKMYLALGKVGTHWPSTSRVFQPT